MKYTAMLFFIIAALFPFQSAAAADETEHIEFKDAAFSLLTEQKQRSVLTDYVHPLLKVFEKDGKSFAWMEWIHPSWLIDLKVEQEGKLTEPKVILSTNKRHVIEFEMNHAAQLAIFHFEIKRDDQEALEKYVVHLQLEENYTNDLNSKESVTLSESKAISSMPRREKIDVTSADTSKKKVPETVVKKTQEEAQQEKQPAPKPTPKEQDLVFDRTKDAEKHSPPVPVQVADEPIQPPLTTDVREDESALSLDLLKVWGLFALCVLSGILFIRRMFNKKKSAE